MWHCQPYSSSFPIQIPFPFLSLLTRQRAHRFVGRVKFDAEMPCQGVEIRLALLQLLHLLPVRSGYSERTVEQRDSTVGGRECRHTGKGKERAGMGRGEVIPIGDVLHRSVCSLYKCYSSNSTPCYLEVGPQDESCGALQLHLTTTGVPAGARHVVVLEEPVQSYQSYQVFHLSLQPHQVCSITRIALPRIVPL
jgi:hypothetical protein